MSYEIPIASLNRSTIAVDVNISGIIALVWPYSASTQTFALQLAAEDFRLRLQHGQVRVIFKGPAARAIAKSKAGISDKLVLSLEGAEWVDNSAVQTPGKSVSGELSFTRRLKVQIHAADSQQKFLDIDEPEEAGVVNDTVPTTLTPVRQTTMTSSYSTGRAKTVASIYESPAFVRTARSSPITADPFVDEEDMDAEHPRKRARISFGNVKSWHFATQSPSPPHDEGEAAGLVPIATEPATGPTTALPSMLPPQLPQLRMPSPVVEDRAPTTPRLYPLSGVSLPLPSPFPNESMQSNFVALDSVQQAQGLPTSPITTIAQQQSAEDTISEPTIQPSKSGEPSPLVDSTNTHDSTAETLRAKAHLATLPATESALQQSSPENSSMKQTLSSLFGFQSVAPEALPLTPPPRSRPSAFDIAASPSIASQPGQDSPDALFQERETTQDHSPSVSYQMTENDHIMQIPRQSSQLYETAVSRQSQGSLMERAGTELLEIVEHPILRSMSSTPPTNRENTIHDTITSAETEDVQAAIAQLSYTSSSQRLTGVQAETSPGVYEHRTPSALYEASTTPKLEQISESPVKTPPAVKLSPLIAHDILDPAVHNSALITGEITASHNLDRVDGVDEKPDAHSNAHLKARPSDAYISLLQEVKSPEAAPSSLIETPQAVVPSRREMLKRLQKRKSETSKGMLRWSEPVPTAGALSLARSFSLHRPWVTPQNAMFKYASPEQPLLAMPVFKGIARQPEDAVQQQQAEHERGDLAMSTTTTAVVSTSTAMVNPADVVKIVLPMPPLLVMRSTEPRQRKSDQAVEAAVDVASLSGFRTKHGYFTRLSTLKGYLNIVSQPSHPANRVDVMVVIVSSPAPYQRQKTRPRDYYTVLRVADQSMSAATSVQVEIYRPYKISLPEAKVGDVILLRAFTVRSRDHGPSLKSNDESAWLVWKFWPDTGSDRERAERSIRGPPIELGEEEELEAHRLREWYKSFDDLLGDARSSSQEEISQRSMLALAGG